MAASLAAIALEPIHHTLRQGGRRGNSGVKDRVSRVGTRERRRILAQRNEKVCLRPRRSVPH